MPIDWKEPGAFTRLLAALVASQEMKLDYRSIATYFGNGATYDSIEGRFRIIRREAQILKKEIESGVRAPAPPRNGNPNSSTATPTKKSRSFQQSKDHGNHGSSNAATPTNSFHNADSPGTNHQSAPGSSTGGRGRERVNGGRISKSTNSSPTKSSRFNAKKVSKGVTFDASSNAPIGDLALCLDEDGQDDQENDVVFMGSNEASSAVSSGQLSFADNVDGTKDQVTESPAATSFVDNMGLDYPWSDARYPPAEGLDRGAPQEWDLFHGLDHGV